MILLALHLATLLGGALAILLSVDILRTRRPPAATLGWLLFMLVVPWLAVPLYLTLGTRKLRANADEKTPLFPLYDRFAEPSDDLGKVLARAGIPPALPGNRVCFHPDGLRALEALLTLICDARTSLDVCMFLFADDKAGRRIMNELEKAAARGVIVRILIDGVGSFLLPKQRIRELADAGIAVARFIPVLHRPFRGRTNLRNHRKFVIADGSRVWLGGRNLADEYFAKDDDWIDLSFDIEGPAVERTSQVFAADWRFATGVTPATPAAAPAMGSSSIQVIPSGPDMPGEPLYDTLLTAVYAAQTRILAVTPYFVPDESLQHALCLAALRGVRVQLILPRQSNHRLADITRNRYLRELAQAGVKILLKPNAMVHAKALVIDDKVALAGSANLDLRSLFLNFELVSLFRSTNDIDTLAAWITVLQRETVPYRPRPVSTLREVFEGLILLLAFQL